MKSFAYGSLSVAIVTNALLLMPKIGSATVKPGENILINGTLECDQTSCPPGWAIYLIDRKLVKPMSVDGPDGLPFLRLKAGKAEKRDSGAYQGGIHLASNGVYRLSARVRTRNFKCQNAGVIVCGPGWSHMQHVGAIPPDTDGKWVSLSREFGWSLAKDCQAAAFATDFTGEFDVADVKLEAVNDAALALTEPSAASKARNEPRFVPFAPLLWNIPRDRREVTFRFFGKTPSEKLEGNELELDVGGKRLNAPLAEEMSICLPPCAEQGQFTVRGIERATGKTFGEECFSYRLIDAPPAEKAIGKRLNNLCTELVSSRLTHGHGAFDFVLPREGWLYIRILAPAREGFSVALDGLDVINGMTPRLEIFRQATCGTHRLTVGGCGEGKAIVRAIADIYNYPPCGGCGVTSEAVFDWEYEKRNILPAVTTENGGRIPENARREFLASGRRWISNLGVCGLDAGGLVKALTTSPGMTEQDLAGVSCDEKYFYHIQSIGDYQRGLKAYDLAHSPEKVIYTWIVGKPLTPSQDHAFFATCANVSRGRGKILLESYCRAAATEEDAALSIRRYVGGTLDTYRKWYPLAIASSCVVFGNFNQLPVLSLSHRPEVDYKRCLDMQVNFAANDPACRDLGAVGYWGTSYADDEMRRWSFALMRHYVVEGRTNLLSSAYGYAYKPGHLLNGDFSGTLAPWQATGSVRTDSHPGYAKGSQCRWGGDGDIGDTFAVLTREADRIASISQKAKGFVPGRKYCLQFITCDAKDVKAGRHAPRRFGIDARLGSGAEICRGLSWTHVDKRVKGRYDFNTGVARVNLHHIVFTAKTSEIPITFDNEAAALGEELGINAVSLNPYFEGSASQMD